MMNKDLPTWIRLASELHAVAPSADHENAAMNAAAIAFWAERQSKESERQPAPAGSMSSVEVFAARAAARTK